MNIPRFNDFVYTTKHTYIDEDVSITNIQRNKFAYSD